MISSLPDLAPLTRYLFLGGELELTPKQKEVFLRANTAHDLLSEYRTEKIVIPMLLAKYRTQDKEYSTTTARRDIATARHLFGTRPAQEKEYLRGESVEWCKEEMRKASAAGDARGFAAIMNVMAKISGIDRDTPNAPDPDDLRNPILTEVTYDPLLLDAPVMDPALREQKLKRILAGKAAEGFNVQELEEGKDFAVIPPDGK